MDGRMDGLKKWHIEVGNPPKNEIGKYIKHNLSEKNPGKQ